MKDRVNAVLCFAVYVVAAATAMSRYFCSSNPCRNVDEYLQLLRRVDVFDSYCKPCGTNKVCALDLTWEETKLRVLTHTPPGRWKAGVHCLAKTFGVRTKHAYACEVSRDFLYRRTDGILFSNNTRVER